VEGIKMIIFNHSGGIGDILFSLYFCKELTTELKQEKFNFHIQTNVEDPVMGAHHHPFGTVRMTEGAANFLKSLLESQDFINKVSIGDAIPANSFNLDTFRSLRINFASGDIRSWYYNLVKYHLPREFWKSVISVKNTNKTYSDKILISSTQRYQNVFINLSELKNYKDNLVFVGTEEEYNIFKETVGETPYLKCSSFLEIAEYIAGAKGFIGNQGGLYSLAECMKVNRILISPEYFTFNNRVFPGPVNNHPQGGWNEVAASTEKLISCIENLLKI
jgi:hypothetical protein